MPSPHIIAHRGASAYAPENTVVAFEMALQQGADTLEFDVRITADDHLVVIHDETLLRTTGDPRRVDAVTWADIERLPPGTRPPRLDDVLGRYAGTTRFLIDLKDPTPCWEGRVVEAIERNRLHGRVAIQSFDIEALRRVHRLARRLPVIPLYRRNGPRPHDVVAEIAAFAGAIGTWHGWVDADLVASTISHGVELRPWTVDHPDDLERLLRLGVGSVVTSAPDVARAVAERVRAPGPGP